jgi:type IV pilus assembly protein PilY1
MKTHYSFAAWVVVLTGLIPTAAWAQSSMCPANGYCEDFTGAPLTRPWRAFNGACLTAGGGGASIPACVGLPYYGAEQLVGGNSGTLPDPVGNGALRFTNGRPGGYHQNGAIVLDPSQKFSSTAGVQITFTTVTYRGDSGGAARDGADGISFFLMDAGVAPDVGAFGGSLAYTCSNANNDPTIASDGINQRGYDGLVGAYLGLGIDEFGNFLNGSNPLTGYNGDNAINLTNAAGGFGYVPNRIGMRGGGHVAWRWLNGNFPTQYPGSLTTGQRASSVQKTCKTGLLWDYSGDPNNPVVSAVQPPASQPLDYPPIPGAFSVLNGVQIANEAAVTRNDGTPITYKLKITTDNHLSLSYSINAGVYQPVISNQDITASNGALPANLLFGFAGSTGGDTNIHEIMCFRATPNNLAASSAGVNQQQTAKVQAGAQVYFAYYNPDTWAGSLTAQNITIDASGNVTGITTPIWDASCVLTGDGPGGGATCPTTGAANVAPQAPNNRTILTWNGAQGIAFEWGKLSAAQRAALDVGDASQTPLRLDYLRGDRTNEEPPAGPTGNQIYRDRASVLGDIIDSSPTWVGPASSPYATAFADKINAGGGFPENAGQSYVAFKAIAQTRLNVVYAGANDGLLHGFRTGSFSAANTFVNVNNDGQEVLAYMPGAVLSGINNIRGNNIPPSNAGVNPTLDFSDPHYSHNFFVDATPGSGDLFYANKWHTWLVGGLGAGGAAIYALDVTDPSAGNFDEKNASNLVIGEWTSQTINCVNVGGCGANLGNTYGIPQIRRFHDGNWGAVFGNGLNTANNSAGIFVMIVNSASSTVSFFYLGTPGSTAGNGIAYATPVDLDGDNIIDYVYAGDVAGNVWRFDLTSKNEASWAVSPGPLFNTGGLPITTKVVVASTPANTGPPRVMVEFGTGSQSPISNLSAPTYANGGQSLFGVWDSDMNAPLTGWDAKGSTQYASLPPPRAIFSTSDLVAQTITTTGNTRAITNNPVCWMGSTDCPSGNTQFGWVVGLPGSSDGGSEQIIFSPTLEVGLFIVNTLIPATTKPLLCVAQAATGFTMAISPTTGGSFANSVFADPSTGTFTNKNINGVQWNGTGSGSIVTGGGTGTLGSNVYFITQTVSGTPLPPQQINPPGGKQGGRLTWIERR